jgi:hypothetical protein
MKTPLTYGALMAIATAALTLLLYFAGFHDNAEKFGTGQLLGTVGGLAIAVVCLALAMREKRASFPAAATWGYGSALGVGMLTGLVASLLGVITAYLYFVIINPGFGDFVVQYEVAKLEAKNIPEAAITQAEGMFKFMTRPAMMLTMQAVGGFVWALVLALLVAIFFRRRERAAPPTL